jgi:hypothetical protein
MLSSVPKYLGAASSLNRTLARRVLCAEFLRSTEVLQEIRYLYSALWRLDFAREVYEIFVKLCPIVLNVTLSDTDVACGLLCDVAGITARDALHATAMRTMALSGSPLSMKTLIESPEFGAPSCRRPNSHHLTRINQPSR